jgi:hypothetical protein
LFKKLIETHLKLANWKVILLLILLFLLANLVIIPWVYPKFQTLDTSSSYSPARAYELISSYGGQGRHAYALIEVTLDLVYPYITALLFSLLAAYTLKRAFPNTPWVLYLSFLPFLILLADYLENACVVTMLLSYPAQLVFVARLSNLFTGIKLALTPVDLLFLVGLLGWLVRIIRSRRPA